MMKDNFFEDLADTGAWWFWLFLPITGTLYAIGWLLDAIGLT